MQKQIAAALNDIKSILAQLAGTSDLPPGEQFSAEAISKAAKQFQKMKVERGEWVKEDDIDKYLKGAGWHTGKFIRAEFGFSNFIKQGHEYYYYKKDLISLNSALKDRNVDIKRYMEYKEDEVAFRKKVAEVKKNKKPFNVPAELKNIITSPVPKPDPEIIREDIKVLKEEFFQYKMADYIDIYRESHAMMKFIYQFQKYMDPQLKRRCKKWCEDFNYANHALELVTGKKQKFTPMKEEDMIQL